MAEALWGREQPRAYFIYCIEQLLCLEHPSRSAWRWAPRQHSCSGTLGRGAPTTVPQQQLHLHNHWAEDGEKPVYVRACVHAPVPGPWRAMCTAGHVCQPAAPARARVLCVGWACFLLHTCLHLPPRFGSREREPVRLMSACAGLCRYFTHSPPCVCVCPCVCVHMRVRTCVRSVSQLAAAPAAGIPASQAVLEMNRLESIFSPLATRFHSEEKRSRALYLH